METQCGGEAEAKQRPRVCVSVRVYACVTRVGVHVCACVYLYARGPCVDVRVYREAKGGLSTCGE
jgi:hypothetical protein